MLFSASPAWFPCCLPVLDHSFERFLNISSGITIVAFAIVIFRILDKGLCDIRVRPCMRTIVRLWGVLRGFRKFDVSHR